MSSKKQSVVFLQEYGWTPEQALIWLYMHGNLPIKSVDRSIPGQLRYRLEDPKHFSRFATIKTNKGILFVLGFP